MQYRSGKELRELFLSFFEEKGCTRFKSFSLIPEDPTLLFTIAGMVPFKPYFLGIKTPEVTRATTSQKCIRTNDIENVRRTARHHTFFEMLGNFSFGDYFKKEIIPWSWEFLTERIGLDPDKLYVTIYLDDDEAYEIWSKDVGIANDRIVRLGDDDNFWAAGPTGPCGPCSEIMYDQGPEFSCGKPNCFVGCDCDRYLEVWNLVFMQYNRDENGKLSLLPKKNIDTGMGLERLASIVQKTRSDFETDLFINIINKTCELAKVKYGTDAKKDLSVRIISDHIRASAFMIADGVLPTNDGPGYVLRRLIRRSARYGKLLGIQSPFLSKLLPAVRESVGNEYDELNERSSAIEQILTVEEERFSKTLIQGNEHLYDEIKKIENEGGKVLSGKVAFTLYDTFGFPIELTAEICDEHLIIVDKKEFDWEMQKQRDRARASSKQGTNTINKTIYTELENKLGGTDFVGYTETSIESTVLAIISEGELRETISTGEPAELILSKTPFYAEGGGQIGDAGLIETASFTFEVYDTYYPAQDMIVHKGSVKRGFIKPNMKIMASVDLERRNSIKRHHTTTHLLNEALCRVLGEHVRQAGSLVTSTFLRFDFNHFTPMSIEEIDEVEKIVNKQILNNLPVKTSLMSFEDAKKTGAKALFDEKYEEEVRVLEIEGFSLEFCGGTHVGNTGEIGFFKIIKEESIASGIRRITAVTGLSALEYIQKSQYTLTSMLSILNEEPDTVVKRLKIILDEKKELEKRNKDLMVKILTIDIENKVKPITTEKEVDLIIERYTNLTPDLLRQIGDSIRRKFQTAMIVLFATGDGGEVFMISMATENAVKKGAHAGTFLKKIAQNMGGKGGGNPALAQGGTKNVQSLDKFLSEIPSIFKDQMTGEA